VAALLVISGFSMAAGALRAAAPIGDGPVIREHLDQRSIEAGRISFETLYLKGLELFTAKFNTFDGGGRPASDGGGGARAPRSIPENFNRVSGPDANACSGCHNDPRPGGGGDNVANVFVLAQLQDFAEDIRPETGNERNTLGMWGAGAIEMLAREMSQDLIEIREAAQERARAEGAPVTLPLRTKGVPFGQITAHPNGSVDNSGVEGVDPDLIIKPFHQKGVVVSLRQFTNNAYNHHHGMQPAERVGDGMDPDGDGVKDELTRGDITAATLFQAALPVPGQRIPRDRVVAQAIARGEELFNRIGCADCHRPALVLNNPIYSEPNPFNPPKNLRSEDVTRPVTFDLTRHGPRPRLERLPDGRALVRCFTDLKRHPMGPLCDNEKLVQAGVPTDVFLTKKLWGFASEAPFMHHGRCTTMTEAILMHGGAAQASRDRFAALEPAQRNEVIEFLKSLQVLPENAEGMVVDEFGKPAPRPQISPPTPPRNGPRIHSTWTASGQPTFEARRGSLLLIKGQRFGHSGQVSFTGVDGTAILVPAAQWTPGEVRVGIPPSLRGWYEIRVSSGTEISDPVEFHVTAE
jgi:hypothetical protein